MLVFKTPLSLKKYFLTSTSTTFQCSLGRETKKISLGIRSLQLILGSQTVKFTCLRVNLSAIPGRNIVDKGGRDALPFDLSVFCAGVAFSSRNPVMLLVLYAATAIVSG